MTQRLYRLGRTHLAVSVQRAADGRFAVTVDGQARDVGATLVDPATVQLDIDGVSHTARVARVGDTVHVHIGGAVYVLTPESAGIVADGDRTAALAVPQIIAPMPGKVLQVLVTSGQSVAEGDGLLILEAMKMEHRMVAEAAGTVRAVHVSDGQMVDAGAILVELDYGTSGLSAGD